MQVPHKLFNYNLLSSTPVNKLRGKNSDTTYNNCIIMLDTETSKEHQNRQVIEGGKLKYETVRNYIVAWSIAVMVDHKIIAGIYGNSPIECVEAIDAIQHAMQGDKTVMYIHNLSYDWVFLRKFLLKQFGDPIRQLQTKPHYPIMFEFLNGLVLRDSLILSQKKLEKWADDLNVEHKKAVGKWQYDKIRTQKEVFTPDEVNYIMNDVYAGVECIDITIALTHSINVYYLPYTATGIVRKQFKKIGQQYRAHNRYLSMLLTYHQYKQMLRTYHGGYVHANRFFAGILIDEVIIRCFDFNSSYPFCMLAYKFPMEKFGTLDDKPISFILDNADDYAFMFKLIIADHVEVDRNCVMPYLQLSKCETALNPVLDNGRILAADYIEINLTEIDLEIIAAQYHIKRHICANINFAKKEYLPRWFTDEIYKLYYNKCVLKGVDDLNYMLEKGKLNSSYGMCVQKVLRDLIEEKFDTGINNITIQDDEELYYKECNKYGMVLPYQWGVWVTAYACRNLFTLGSYAETWLYSDTDSVYGINFDLDKIAAYNENCRRLLELNSYDPIIYNGKEFCLGVAVCDEHDDVFKEFKTLGAKKYVCRKMDDTIKLTVAGVPKKAGAACLNNDLNNFDVGFIFKGEDTGKLTHTYNYIDAIYEENGIIYGDYIDLTPCDYTLDKCRIDDFVADDLYIEEDVCIESLGESLY